MASHRLPSLRFLYMAVIACFVIISLASSTDAEPLTLAKRVRHLYCTSSEYWLTPTFNGDDCYEANTRFVLTDYNRYKHRRLEFLDRDSAQTSHFTRMLTPRRYTIGTCTLVVAMLWSFPQEPPLPPLPGDPKGPWAKSEVLSFNTIYEAVQQIVVRCSGTKVPLGWMAAGTQRNLGVYFMATGSLVERNIPIGAAGAEYLRNVTKGIDRSKTGTAKH